jgi:glutamate--cysteine ligase catalytic subunit
MGLLTKGKPLSWKEAQKHIDYVKDHGISQFVHLYNQTKDVSTACFKWGDEIEGMLVVLSKKSGRCCRLLLRGPEILEQLDAASSELRTAQVSR